LRNGLTSGRPSRAWKSGSWTSRNVILRWRLKQIGARRFCGKGTIKEVGCRAPDNHQENEGRSDPGATSRMTEFLFIGASGLLGQHLLNEAESRRFFGDGEFLFMLFLLLTLRCFCHRLPRGYRRETSGPSRYPLIQSRIVLKNRPRRLLHRGKSASTRNPSCGAHRQPGQASQARSTCRCFVLQMNPVPLAP